VYRPDQPPKMAARPGRNVPRYFEFGDVRITGPNLVCIRPANRVVEQRQALAASVARRLRDETDSRKGPLPRRAGVRSGSRRTVQADPLISCVPNSGRDWSVVDDVLRLRPPLCYAFTPFRCCCHSTRVCCGDPAFSRHRSVHQIRPPEFAPVIPRFRFLDAGLCTGHQFSRNPLSEM
jgi:hypothetical protein